MCLWGSVPLCLNGYKKLNNYMRYISIPILTFLLFFIACPGVYAANTIKIIAIDPGHGGQDTGYIAEGIIEKDYTMAIARKLRKKLISTLGVMVVLTRSGDYSVSAEERLGTTNNQKADMLISLHLNTYFVPSAHGVSFYIYQPGKKILISRETPTWEEAQNRFIEQSISLANCMRKAFVRNNIFACTNAIQSVTTPILAGATMPATLIEMGYLTNPSDFQTLRTRENDLVKTLYMGITLYKKVVEQRGLPKREDKIR